ncbi:nicotinate-nucleotide adenylyltransferase [Aquibacillus albus]|uniref:Probable nicotinate-nucleotide adenylyltransferase n=1 Tax=Aquibacillus albus TaxID=1168171 RepID=A0ABS2MV46_9BACI|nr:nicotinate-nucleotide adenylyltransferase [Aquibacillus albus]MBM7569595.1 nicotinate-nucleotide adenylyltransferase [Aquibacillus albus]
MKKIGLLGGTFDPPHNGHLLIAEEVYHSLGLDEVWFIPSYEPPHKEKSQTPVHLRVEMLENAIMDNDHFFINAIEIERKGKSYTIDTIKYLKEQYSDFTFYFIIGADMVEYLPKWHNIDDLIEIIQFVGVKRTDFQLNSKYPIKEVNIPVMEISSTMIRDRVSQGKSIKYLVPDKVLDIIRENQLYGSI